MNLLSKIFNDTKHRVVSVYQLSYFYGILWTENLDFLSTVSSSEDAVSEEEDWATSILLSASAPPVVAVPVRVVVPHVRPEVVSLL